ncbi:hypothetical protein ACPOL_2764 [Acidisarcina polymorpha]|uniref:Uncharacterized protein n=1 Tax=Acidisarcina polymorpha TaxID=2211140 RepID=A0A2Z5G0A6_9BACT|nr:hypothetical protein ACPOL_2764 [Acidisarcina polymorpha]
MQRSIRQEVGALVQICFALSSAMIRKTLKVPCAVRAAVLVFTLRG